MGYYDVAGEYDLAGLQALLGQQPGYSAGEDLSGLSWQNALMPHTLITEALARRRGRGNPHPAIAAAAAQRAALVSQHEPSRGRRLMLPVDSATTIAALASSTLTLTPTNVFKPDRLVVDSAIAPSFVITDIKVGRASQLIGSGSIPAVAFSPALGENNISFDTVQTSQPLAVSVTNTSAAALRFMAVFFGWEVE